MWSCRCGKGVKQLLRRRLQESFATCVLLLVYYSGGGGSVVYLFSELPLCGLPPPFPLLSLTSSSYSSSLSPPLRCFVLLHLCLCISRVSFFIVPRHVSSQFVFPREDLFPPLLHLFLSSFPPPYLPLHGLRPRDCHASSPGL